MSASLKAIAVIQPKSEREPFVLQIVFDFEDDRPTRGFETALHKWQSPDEIAYILMQLIRTFTKDKELNTP